MQSLKALASLKSVLLSRTLFSDKVYAAIRTGSGRQNYTLSLSWPISCVTLFS